MLGINPIGRNSNGIPNLWNYPVPIGYSDMIHKDMRMKSLRKPHMRSKVDLHTSHGIFHLRVYITAPVTSMLKRPTFGRNLNELRGRK